jgi:hypothetical protein
MAFLNKKNDKVLTSSKNEIKLWNISNGKLILNVI